MDLVIRRQSEQFENKFNHQNPDIFYDRELEWGFLRKQCMNLELETFYKTYMQRLQRSYLSIFIVFQAVIGIVHSVILMTSDRKAIYPEVIAYLATILVVWISLFITFREDFIKRYQWIAYVASFIAIIALVLSDLIVPLIHATLTFPKPPLRPTYGSYILYAVYIFVPLSENWHAVILGLAVTSCYLIEFAFVTYRLDEHLFIKMATETFFLLIVNFFGIYFRLMKEIAIRTTFLDRRGCVEENLMLRYARDQEKNLLLSILPSHIAEDLEKDIRKKFEELKEELKKPRHRHRSNHLRGNRSSTIKKWRRKPRDELNVQEHKNVSVLYADVVNYTFMTTQLDVKPLVETLHELFVKFDQASEEYNVLRIKFLGDCYYCVSGVPEQNPYHAKSCVDLGLRMIRDIRDVRNRRKLNIDMRIGVHSGNILSGIIGACKWQYDIWSKDVDIANKLESTGKAGRVHVTRQTLDLLNGAYLYEEGTQAAKNDSVLKKHGIETFLIVPQIYNIDNRYLFSEETGRPSVGVRRLLENSRKSRATDSSVHKNFMQNTIEQFIQIRAQVSLEMRHELDKMPIGKFHLSKICSGSPKLLTQDEQDEQNFRSNVSTILLLFKNIRWELLFLVEPDIMLKYSSLIGLVTFFGILCIQAINKSQEKIFWMISAVSAVILISFLPLTWFKKLWIVLTPAPDDDNDPIKVPKSKIAKILYRLSHNIMQSIISRTTIYLITVLILTVCSLPVLLECPEVQEVLFTDDYIQSSSNSSDLTNYELCLNPWATTESLVLTICMSFLFVRIPFIFKFLIGLGIVLAYGWVVFMKFPYIYDQSPSTNFALDPKSAHIFIVAITFGIFHMVDRQTEYIAKVDYNWKRQLQKKQKDAEFTNETIKLLVHNILPAHVADIYMSRKMKDELYNEKYDNVAIMFATIKNCDVGDEQLSSGNKTVLNILNSIICDFDDILMSHTGPLKIEKIKVAGWTYMAACGLEPGRCDSTTSFTGYRNASSQRSSAMLPSTRWSRHSDLHNRSRRLSLDINYNSEPEEINGTTRSSSKQSHNVVYVLTEFALELMRALQSFNREIFQKGTLRVGISHGEIMAGVVGSSKPLYDVWGNAVNMASRMDSTGMEGKIQVTDETAKVLKSFGINCQYRGLTYVKGKNHIPTHFVEFDEHFNFIRHEPITQSRMPNNGNVVTTKL